MPLTQVAVTHHLGDIIPEIARVILLKNGRVFRDGPKQEVLTAELLSDLFGSPVDPVRRDGYFRIWRALKSGLPGQGKLAISSPAARK